MSREKIGELLLENNELWASYALITGELFVSCTRPNNKKHKKLQAEKDDIAAKIGVCCRALVTEINETISALEFWNKYGAERKGY